MDSLIENKNKSKMEGKLMKKEFRILRYSIINNFIIAIIKVIGGAFFGLGSLFADGLHTFSDGIINLVALVGMKLSKKRPTKNHPYGFGRVEYLTNLYIGLMLFALGVYIFIHSLGKEVVIPPLSVLWLLLIVSILKGISIIIMFRNAKKRKSKIMLATAKEGLADIYSSIGVAIITIVLQLSTENPILIHIDMIGTMIISYIIFRTAFKMIRENSLLLVGEIEENKEIIEKVKQFLLKHYDEIQDEDIYLIKYGSYYKLQLNIQLGSNFTLKRITNLEKRIKREILKQRSLMIKHVTIFVTNKLEK